MYEGGGEIKPFLLLCFLSAGAGWRRPRLLEVCDVPKGHFCAGSRAQRYSAEMSLYHRAGRLAVIELEILLPK
jgi:hypothetical protein